MNQNGIGFGLTISKLIIEELGGQIQISNNNSDPLNQELIQKISNMSIQERGSFFDSFVDQAAFKHKKEFKTYSSFDD